MAYKSHINEATFISYKLAQNFLNGIEANGGRGTIDPYRGGWNKYVVRYRK